MSSVLNPSSLPLELQRRFLGFCDIFDLRSYGATDFYNRELCYQELRSRLISALRCHFPKTITQEAFWLMLENSGSAIIGKSARHILFPFSQPDHLSIGIPISSYGMVRDFIVSCGAEETATPPEDAFEWSQSIVEEAPDILSHDSPFNYDLDHDHEPDANVHIGVQEIHWFKLRVSLVFPI
jgi:hypothetical protein